MLPKHMTDSNLEALDFEKRLPEGLRKETFFYDIIDTFVPENDVKAVCTFCNKAKGKFLKQNQFSYRGERFSQFECPSCKMWFSPDYDQRKICNDDYLETFEAMDDMRVDLRFGMMSGLRLEEGERLLEIGCGLGVLLKKIQVNYPNLKVVGLEDSHKMVARMLELGLEAHQEQSTICERFDRVIAHHVIEHCGHPEDFHQLLQKLCIPGAIIQITFPNRENWFVEKGLFPDLHLPMHRFYFSLAELHDFFRSRGYRILECSSNEERRFIPNLTQAIYNHLRSDLNLFKNRYGELCEWVESIPIEEVELIERELSERNLGSEGCLLIAVPKD